ncbi:hypothetical protein SKAU_G00271850 [Synaphobranchus kaupii]|uniref:Uncharacterized protein n=1 Tax=Synaphobranchus kaupii TaxID=118154 RepID=A0A9Q1F0S7_SYNKA|nr:hypothetical protein SKAU_G00271850 [Synaphobranchus kaupii]
MLYPLKCKLGLQRKADWLLRVALQRVPLKRGILGDVRRSSPGDAARLACTGTPVLPPWVRQSQVVLPTPGGTDVSVYSAAADTRTERQLAQQDHYPCARSDVNQPRTCGHEISRGARLRRSPSRRPAFISCVLRSALPRNRHRSVFRFSVWVFLTNAARLRRSFLTDAGAVEGVLDGAVEEAAAKYSGIMIPPDHAPNPSCAVDTKTRRESAEVGERLLAAQLSAVSNPSEPLLKRQRPASTHFAPWAPVSMPPGYEICISQGPLLSLQSSELLSQAHGGNRMAQAAQTLNSSSSLHGSTAGLIGTSFKSAHRLPVLKQAIWWL